MVTIVKGTTPDITVSFSNVDVVSITSAVLTITRSGVNVITKTLAEATIEGNSITWGLTQDETLGIPAGGAEMVCNWITNSGLRGASKCERTYFAPNPLNEVMT